MSISKPNFALDEEYRQIALDLELPEVESDGVSIEEARLRSEAARGMFEKSGYKWGEEYLELRKNGWPWRQAAFIAWAALPKTLRVPKTQEELAQKVLGLTSDRSIMVWRNKNPMIDEMIGLLQSAPLFDYRSEIFKALIENAIKPDYKTHNDRKLALEMLGDYVPASKIAAEITRRIGSNDLVNLSDDELAQLAKSIVNKDAE
jgi:hypothetical protein